MIIATCIPAGISTSEALCAMKPESQKKSWSRKMRSESFVARGANERFHMIEITLQCPTTGGRQTILRMRQPATERLLTANVAGFLQLARVDAQVPIRGLHELLQLVEAQHLVDGQRA